MAKIAIMIAWARASIGTKITLLKKLQIMSFPLRLIYSIALSLFCQNHATKRQFFNKKRLF